MDKELLDVVNKLATSLNDHQVDYLFVGGIAMAYYGVTRPSSGLEEGIEYDIDRWHQPVHKNFYRLSSAIAGLVPEL